MATFEQHSWVWVPDAEECFVPAKVKQNFKAGEAGTVYKANGEERILTPEETKDLHALHEEALDPKVDNLVNFNELTENALLHNLRIRFKEDKVYTYVSSILISVNPFKLLPIYTPDVLESYRQSSRDKEPHVFAVADNAYRTMMSEHKNQSVVISGESGAGKSEATKLILQYLAEASAGGHGHTAGLEEQILQSNPLMEAFGNAKTVRNNNSSRFGKLITVYFDQLGSIRGGSVISYLLEKSRVVYQMKEERNYHIFYQLLAGAEAHADIKKSLRLDSPSTFHYTSQSGVDKIEGVSDEKDFEEVKRAMETLGMGEKEQHNVFRVVATVLHFGNVRFDVVTSSTAEDGSKIANMEQLAFASSLLSLDADTMARALLYRNVGNKSVVLVNYTATQAAQARDAMTKALYAALFDWLMKKINAALSSGVTDLGAATGRTIIGVLDIFGFESFETNSFEQLCINYCNEKLQFHFNEHIFRLETDVYEAEGVNVAAITFKDNRPTLVLLEDKTTGLFSMIDEEMNVPRGSDDTYLNKLKTKHVKHESFSMPKIMGGKAGTVVAGGIKDAAKCFGIKHYAGEVFYNVTNFIEKNKDTLSVDILNALQASTSPFMEELFPKPKEDASAKAGRRMPTGKSAKVTLGAQFKSQLTNLVDTLNSTSPHFVRCMKPNTLKKGNVFQSPMVLAQLRYAGLLEVCRIRKLGFPIRREFEVFSSRFSCLVPGKGLTLDQLVAGLEQAGHLKPGMWAKGKTKLFLKAETASDLEVAREVALRTVTITVQKYVRRWLLRIKYKSWRTIMGCLRKAIQERSLEHLETCLEMTGELPYQGNHLKEVKAARELKQRILEENRVTALVEQATQARDHAGLRAALASADSMSPPLVSPPIVTGRALLTKLEEEAAIKARLQAAISIRNRKALQDALGKAGGLRFECDEVTQGLALLARLEEEEQVILSLRTAISKRGLVALKGAVAKALEMNFEVAEVAQGRELLVQLEAEHAAKATLASAVKERNLYSLRMALEKATHAGLGDSAQEIAHAKSLLTLLEREKAAVQALKAAVDARQLDTLQTALAEAQSLGLTSGVEYINALSVRDKCTAEERVRVELKEATAKSDPDLLSAAIAEAIRLGLTGPEVDAARAGRFKLGEQSAIRMTLGALCSSDDLDAINSALAEAGRVGVMDIPEVIVLQERKKAIEGETTTIEDLRAALKSMNIENLNKALSSALSSSVAAKYPAEVAKAKEIITRAEAAAKLHRGLQDAVKERDEEQLLALIARADEQRLTEKEVVAQVAEAKKLVTVLAEERTLLAELQAAADSKKWKNLESLLLKAAKSTLSKDKMEPFRVLVERSRHVGLATDALVEATSRRNLKELQDAIALAIKMGMEGPELSGAVKARDEIIKQEAIVQDMRAAVAALESKGQDERGIKAADIQPLCQLITKAEEHDFGSHAAVEAAVKLRDRMLEQLEVQDLLASALASGNTEEMRAAVDRAEDLQVELEDMHKAKGKLREFNRTLTLVSPEEGEEDEEEEEGGDEEEKQAAEEEEEHQQQRKAEEEEKSAAVVKMVMKGDLAKPRVAEEDKPVVMRLSEGAKGLKQAVKQQHAVAPPLEQERVSPRKPEKTSSAKSPLPAKEPEKPQKPASPMRAAKPETPVVTVKLPGGKTTEEELVMAAKEEEKAAIPAEEEASHAASKPTKVAAAPKAVKAKEAQEENEEEEDAAAEEDERTKAEWVKLQRRERARNPKYHFRHFAGLRTPDDYAKGVLMNKKKVKDGMLVWQNTVINRSLLDVYDPNFTAAALSIHKSLLGYMGDKAMSFPATLALDVVTRGHSKPALRDEIYLQILKQLSSNPKAESIARGWQVLCMCINTFLPSNGFQDYLMNYILEKEHTKGAIANYSRYCLCTLEGMMASGASGLLPTIEEVSAYKERPPVLATIELVDGTVISEHLPVTPDLNVTKVAAICSHFLDMYDARKQHFGIFVYDQQGEPEYLLPKEGGGSVVASPSPPYHDLPRTPRPLGADDFMGSVLVERVRQRRNHKFVFKRKICLPEDNGVPSDDPMYRHLMFIQVVDEVCKAGNLRYDDVDTVVKIVAIAVLVNYGEDAEEQADVMAYVPHYMKARLSEEAWKEKVMEKCKSAELAEKESDDLKQDLVDIVSAHPMYGAHFFHVHKESTIPDIVARLPVEMTFAFSSTGLHIWDRKNLDTEIQTFAYADIYKWGGSSTQFCLILWNPFTQSQFELCVVTAQAPDMAAIILDYIHALMASQQKTV